MMEAQNGRGWVLREGDAGSCWLDDGVGEGGGDAKG